MVLTDLAHQLEGRAAHGRWSDLKSMLSASTDDHEIRLISFDCPDDRAARLTTMHFGPCMHTKPAQQPICLAVYDGVRGPCDILVVLLTCVY